MSNATDATDYLKGFEPPKGPLLNEPFKPDGKLLKDPLQQIVKPLNEPRLPKAPLLNEKSNTNQGVKK